MGAGFFVAWSPHVSRQVVAAGAWNLYKLEAAPFRSGALAAQGEELMSYAKPLPRLSKEDRPFWEALKRHEFLLPRCRECGNVWFPPYLNCKRCLSFDREWISASGRGKVWGFVEMAQNYIPSFAAELPYNVALVQLEEGPFMFSNIIDLATDALQIGMPVTLVYQDVTDEFALPKFRAMEPEG